MAQSLVRLFAEGDFKRNLFIIDFKTPGIKYVSMERKIAGRILDTPRIYNFHFI